MGLITSREQTMLDGPVASGKNHHVRQPSTRSRTKPPMPDRDELENRFIKVLVSLESQLLQFAGIMFTNSDSNIRTNYR